MLGDLCMKGLWTCASCTGLVLMLEGQVLVEAWHKMLNARNNSKLMKQVSLSHSSEAENCTYN